MPFITEYYYYLFYSIFVKLFGIRSVEHNLRFIDFSANAVTLFYFIFIFLGISKQFPWLGSIQVIFWILILLLHFFRSSKNFYGFKHIKMLKRNRDMKHRNLYSLLIILAFPIFVMMTIL
jgi:hypothetical protein